MCCKRRAQQRALYHHQLQQEAQGYRTTFDALGNKIVVPVAATTANVPSPYAPYGGGSGCGSRRQRRCGANAFGNGSVAVSAVPVYAPIRRGCCGGGGGYRREERRGLISLVVGLIVEHYEKKKEEKREEERKALEGGVERGVVTFDRDGDEEVALRVAREQKNELGADVDAGNVEYRDVDERGLDGLPSYETAVSK